MWHNCAARCVVVEEQLAFEVNLGNRYEPRAQAGVQVKVSGIDLNGYPFKQSAQAHNVSRRGACIDGIGCLRGPGETIEIEHRGKKAKFVVAWVGIAGTPENNRIGVRNRDQVDIWKLDLPKPEPDQFQPPSEEQEAVLSPSPAPLTTNAEQEQRFLAEETPAERKERRRYRRYEIHGGSTLQVKGSDVRTWAKLTDVSPGGCYVESYAPFPAKTELQMMLEVGEVRVAVEGIVKVVYPGLGMGIEFTQISDAHRQEIERLNADRPTEGD